MPPPTQKSGWRRSLSAIRRARWLRTSSRAGTIGALDIVAVNTTSRAAAAVRLPKPMDAVLIVHDLQSPLVGAFCL